MSAMAIVAPLRRTAAHGVRREGPLRPGRAEGEEPDPRQSRCAGPSLEYVTLCTTSPRTPGTVPTTLRPSGRSTWASSEIGGTACCPAATSSASGAVIRLRSASASCPGGSAPRARSASRQAVRSAPPNRSWSTRSAICHRSSPSRSMGMASSKSRVLSPTQMSSRSRRNARTGWRRKRSSWSSPTVAGNGRCQRVDQERRGRRDGGLGGAGAGQVERVEAPRSVRHQRARARSCACRRAAADARTRWRPARGPSGCARCAPRRRAAPRREQREVGGDWSARRDPRT